jgi:hypothetical protein
MMKRLTLVLSLALLPGCAGGSAYLNTYRAGVITKEVVTQSHKELWSDPLRSKAEVCSQAVPEDGSVAELDDCLKPYTKSANDKVVLALAAYKTAATTLTTILIAAEKNPDGVDKVALRNAIEDTIGAARGLIALFPKAQAWADRLEMLLKGLV